MIHRTTIAKGVLGGAFLALATMGQANAVPVVHTSDFIADGTRTHFNGFQSIPNDGAGQARYTGGSGPYTEDTIQVRQINGDGGNDIWVNYNLWPGATGGLNWYPFGGDNGYTAISLTGGVDFADVGFNYGSGYTPTDITVVYALLDNGATVFSGSAFLSGTSTNYLGFSGGGFDTIIMRASLIAGGTVTDGTFQALAVDNIETQGVSAVTAVPEPATIALFGVGLAGLGAVRRRRKAKAA